MDRSFKKIISLLKVRSSLSSQALQLWHISAIITCKIVRTTPLTPALLAVGRDGVGGEEEIIKPWG